MGGRVETWAPRAAGLAAFAAYALGAPPGPSADDPDGVQAAAFQLGSGWPASGPLTSMLARAAVLVPVGEISFRVHLLSAVAGALAVLWIARLVQQGSRGDAGASVAAAGGALVAAASLSFAHGATATMAAPTAAVAAGLLRLLDRVARGGDARAGLALALVAGLGAGVHPWLRALVPLPVAALLLVRLHRGARWPLVAPLMAVGAAAAIHLLVPVRAATGRDGSIADPASHRAAALLARVHAPPPGAEDPVAPGRWDEVARLAAAAIDDSGALGALAALFGALALALERRGRWLLFALAAIAGGVALEAGVSPGTGRPDPHAAALLALCAGTLAGTGLVWLARVADRAGAAVAAASAVLVVTAPAMMTVPSLARWASDDGPRRAAETIGPIDRDAGASPVVRFLRVTEGPPPAAPPAPHGTPGR